MYQKITFLLILTFVFLCAPYADENTNKKLTKRHIDAVNKALEYLAKTQDAKEGYWSGSGRSRSRGKYAIATTSFAVMAFLGNGHMPGRGIYGDNISKGISFILGRVGHGGYISKPGDDSRMHGHGYATLMLAQVYGMATEDIIIRDKTFKGQRVITNEKLKKDLRNALKLIAEAQTPEGGWGYEPDAGSNDHEGSITVTQLQALRAAHNSGIHINSAIIKRALSYLRRSAKKNGSFKYRLNDSTAGDSYGLTAAAISTFHAIGDYDSREVRNGFDFLSAGKYRDVATSKTGDQYYSAFWCYAQLYAAEAFFHHRNESVWEKFYYKPKGIRAFLLNRQKPDGSWVHPGNSFRFNKSYSTAVLVLILEIPLNYLPIFQR